MVRHHERLREAFPRIGALLDTVVRAHGDDRPELRSLKLGFEQFRTDLELHLCSEEELLFPACAALERQGRPVEEALLAAHERDHTTVGDGLRALRTLADDYDPRRALCNTHGMLLDALAAFDLDLRRLLDEENNLLFPQVRRLGRQRELERAPRHPRQPREPQTTSRDIERAALPRCCEAWIGEQGRAWARRRAQT
jgi:regulator of cell morphogenesis and NO signaling